MKLHSPRIALFGSGPIAQRWAWALAEHASLDSGTTVETDAVVLAPDSPEPAAIAQEALRQSLPVLWACAQVPRQRELAQLAGAAQATAFLRFYEAFRGGGFGLLHRLLSGPEPFWRPLYVRMVSGAGGGCSLEEAAIQALATAQALLNVDAQHVTARAVRQDNGEALALFMTVQYTGGPILECTVSLAEAGGAITVATRDRQLTLENGCLQIRTIDGGLDPTDGRVFSAAPNDSVAEAARHFVNAVSNGDAAEGNIERWLKVAELWAAARRSLDQDEAVWLRRPNVRDTRTPPVKLIEGGAVAARIASGRRLTLVAG